jgi:hypothetical protein
VQYVLPFFNSVVYNRENQFICLFIPEMLGKKDISFHSFRISFHICTRFRFTLPLHEDWITKILSIIKEKYYKVIELYKKMLQYKSY